MTLLLISCCDLKVAHRGMAPAIKLIFPQALVARPPPLVGHLMGNHMFHRCAFTQRGSAALGMDLRAQLLLELLILADTQAPTMPAAGGGALPA